MKRAALIFCLGTVLLLAMALPAFADTSGTVYGRAVLAPYAVVISGPGTDPNNPLTYQGNLGQYAWEQFGNRVTVQNVGTQEAELSIVSAQLPTDGAGTWNLDTASGADTARWAFDGSGHLATVLPDFSPDTGILSYGLSAGQSDSFESSFTFPTSSSSSGDHYMQATISVVPAPN
jgi:hypothetical protein